MEAMKGKRCELGSADQVDQGNQLDNQQIEVRGCSDPRILVVASPAAETALGGFNGVQQLAQVAISQLNDVFDNSDLNISANLTGVEILDNFVEPPDIQDALDNLIIEAADERDDHFADLVVMFTDRYNTGAVGATYLGPPNAFAVVNQNLATNELTFVHEVGHMYGANHENVDCLTEPSCQVCNFNPGFAHGNHFKTGVWPFRKDRWTVMRSCTELRSFIGYFSNPNVNFKNKPTGVANDRDNARQINDTRCTVGNHRGDPPPPMLVSISGPHKAHNNTNYTWCATVSNCTNVSSYDWEYSTDGFNYYPWSTFACNVAMMPIDQDLFLRLTATCSDNRTATDFFVTLNLDAPYLVNNHTTPFGKEEINLNISKEFDVLVKPNLLTNNNINYTLKIPEVGHVSIMLMDQLGRKIYTLSEGELQKGSINTLKVLPNLPSGMYFLRTTWKDQIINKKLVIQ